MSIRIPPRTESRALAVLALFSVGVAITSACSSTASTPGGATSPEAGTAVDACKTYCGDCGDNQCLDQCVDARKKTAAACHSQFDTLFVCGAKAVAKEERCVKGFAPDTKCPPEAAAVDACTAAAPPPEAGACKSLGAACELGGQSCCSGLNCDSRSSACCALSGSACTKNADCCNAGDTIACVGGKCGVNAGPPVPACYKEGDAIGLVGTAPTRTPGLCSTTQIADFEAVCLGSGSASAACTAAIAANRACARCLFGALTGDDASTTPIGAMVSVGADTTPNIEGCAGLVLGRPECGLALAKANVCVSSACATCSASDDDACRSAAETRICLSTVDAACAAAVNAAAAFWAPTCKGANLSDTYRKVAQELCGAP